MLLLLLLSTAKRAEEPTRKGAIAGAEVLLRFRRWCREGRSVGSEALADVVDCTLGIGGGGWCAAPVGVCNRGRLDVRLDSPAAGGGGRGADTLDVVT